MFAFSGTKYDGVQLPGTENDALGSKAFSLSPSLESDDQRLCTRYHIHLHLSTELPSRANFVPCLHHCQLKGPPDFPLNTSLCYPKWTQPSSPRETDKTADSKALAPWHSPASGR
ncbi:unnamed protein product [Pleuronectes platessa]|uniref:Uncharacterized protein n=1 Tax=Pleuronectes platessa TaxID=8262 RepID=A0A9N7Y6F1_PLEPL|nr:unnamed protein product [Pleuronectes platessa]